MKKRFYLDYAATTPVDLEVFKAMRPYFIGKSGNPGSLHFFGQEAMAVVDVARENIGKAISADFREIIFTGSATEANNLALRGLTANYQLPTSNKKNKRKIIVSEIEHESVLETARDLEKEGIEVVYLPVNKFGIVDLKKLEAALDENTILVSVMYANNEIGSIQPIAKISETIKNFRDSSRSSLPLFHSDAAQAFQFFDCDANKLGVDLMTLSAHKIYGPKGIGALYVSNRQPTTYSLQPIITGGGQEFGLRSGTENVPLIVGFAKAVGLAVKNREKERKRIFELKKYFWKELKKIYPKAEANVPVDDVKKYLPNILNICFNGIEAQDLIIKLDLNGIAVSTGSACSTRAYKPSHVLKAMGLSDKKITSSLRFSLGKFTDKKELKNALKIIKKILK